MAPKIAKIYAQDIIKIDMQFKAQTCI